MREQLLAIFEAAVVAVKPDQALLRHIHLQGNTLLAGGQKYNLERRSVKVVGAGKGAAPMAEAVEKILGQRISQGYIVVKYGHALTLSNMMIKEASHPVPDSSGEAGAREILKIAESCSPEDLLICLFTGGASALLPAPANGLTLEEIQATTSLLLSSGAPIQEVNAVRKHLSKISGGRLAQAANGANILSIIISDVIGDDLEAIASGPTAPDGTTFGECLEIIRKYKLTEQLPASILRHLEAGAAGKVEETPKPGAACFDKVTNIIVASNGQALLAAQARAEELGYRVDVQPTPMTGEASDVAHELIDQAKMLARKLGAGDPGICLLAGGETTVTVTGEGLGGRNQEMALTAAIELEGIDNIAALFAGTDGTDGPTDATGGFACGDSVSKMDGKAREFLVAHDSYHALKKSRDLLVTGPTLTNVMDIAIILIRAPE